MIGCYGSVIFIVIRENYEKPIVLKVMLRRGYNIIIFSFYLRCLRSISKCKIQNLSLQLIVMCYDC